MLPISQYFIYFTCFKNEFPHYVQIFYLSLNNKETTKLASIGIEPKTFALLARRSINLSHPATLPYAKYLLQIKDSVFIFNLSFRPTSTLIFLSMKKFLRQQKEFQKVLFYQSFFLRVGIQFSSLETWGSLLRCEHLCLEIMAVFVVHWTAVTCDGASVPSLVTGHRQVVPDQLASLEGHLRKKKSSRGGGGVWQSCRTKRLQ